MTGVLPHFTTRARLILTEVKEETINMQYVIFDDVLSSKAKEDRSTILGEVRPTKKNISWEYNFLTLIGWV